MNIFILSSCISVVLGRVLEPYCLTSQDLKSEVFEHATASSQGAGGLRILAEYFVPSGTVDIGSDC